MTRATHHDAEVFARLPLLAGMPGDVVAALLADATLTRLRPGDVAFREGDGTRQLHVLVDGIVELSRIEGLRDCGILIVVAGGLLLPAAALVDEPCLASARALTKGRLLSIDAATFRAQAGLHPPLALRLAELLAGQWRMAVRTILDLKCRTAPARLAAFLLRVAGDAPEPGGVELPFPKRHLAARVGMTPETLSRTLQLLADNGLHLRGSRIFVRDAARAREFCGPDPYPARHRAGYEAHAL